MNSQKQKTKKAQSTIEYIVLLFFILGTFVIFQKYIMRAVSGRWKAVGDSIGQGKLYDPKKTIECEFDSEFNNRWYNMECFRDNCYELCYDLTSVDCGACIYSSQCDSDLCNE